jgi:hypothetical protein
MLSFWGTSDSNANPMIRAIALNHNLVIEGAALLYWWYLESRNCELGIVHPYQTRMKAAIISFTAIRLSRDNRFIVHS